MNRRSRASTPAPFGDYEYTVGNNVDARVDWFGDGIGQRSYGGPDQEWFYPFQNAYVTTGAFEADADSSVAGS